MVRRIARFIALIVLTLPGCASAQSVPFLHLGLEEGLPSLEVYQVFKDHEGFMWFATDNGVVRFDGRDLKVFQSNDGLPDPVIFGFYEDNKNRLWFRSYSGKLSYFLNSEIHKYKFNDTLVKLCHYSIMRSLRLDSLDQLWFVADHFTGRITPDGHAVHQLSRPDQFSFWQASNDYSAIWKGKKYVAFANQLYEIRDQQMHRVLKGADVIISLSVDLQDNLWIGYLNTDCQRFENDDFADPYVPEFLKGKSVTGILQDSSKGFWISTLKNGVYHVPSFDYVKFELPVPGRIKSTVSDGNVVAVNEEGAVMLIDGKTYKTKQNAHIQDLPVSGVFGDSRKNIWITTRTKTYLFDSLLRLKKKSLMRPNAYFEDRNGKVWGVDPKQINQYDSNGEVLRTIAINQVHRSVVRADPYIIMTTRTGFDVFDENFNLVTSPPMFSDYKIPEILNLNDSTILVATIGNGFFIVSKRNWSADHYWTGANFMANNIYSVKVIDSAIWLGTEKGIAITSLGSILKKKPTYRLLTDKNGLIDSKVDQILLTKRSVWAISGNRACITPLLHTPAPVQRCKFYLKAIRVNSISAHLNGPMTFHSNENDIEIDFGFIDFVNSTAFTRSRLTKSDAWVYSSDRVLHYNKLAPGTYHLELEYSADNSTWYSARTDVAFRIRPPWYLRWYSVVFFMLLIPGAFYLFFRVRLSMLREKNLRLNLISSHQKRLLEAEIETTERERTRIAKDLHDGAGMGLTVLKLKLHQIFGRIKETREGAGEEAEEVLTQINSTIQEIRDTIYNLTPAGLNQFGLTNSLRAYIQKSVSSLSVKIDVHESGPGVLDPRISLSCFRILQELISNSLKHSGATNIGIHIHNFDNDIDILYTDNGKGFIREKENPGKGLLNIESRIEHLDGVMEFSSGEFGVAYRFYGFKNVEKDKHLAGG